MSRLIRVIEGTVSLVAALLIVAACAPAAPAGPTAAPTQAAPAGKPAAKVDTAEWDRTLAAAKQEGKVAVAGPPGDAYRAPIDEFQKMYPDIKVNYAGNKTVDIAAKIKAEREAGQFLWDVFIGGGPQARDLFLKPGYLDPLRPALMMPEVLDDSKWEGGFASGFIDASKEYIYRFGTDLAPVAFVNRKLAPKTELNTIDGLLDPKWKGKIGMRPATAGLVRNSLGIQLIVRGKDGEPWLQKFLTQDIKILDDERMVAEGLIRGTFAVAIGVTPTTIDQFSREGLAADIEPLDPDTPTGSSISGGQAFTALFKNPPSPNAQKIFINWLLSKAGQQPFENNTNTPVRRLDTEKTSTAPRVKPGVNFILMDTEEVQPYMDKATQMINAATK